MAIRRPDQTIWVYFTERELHALAAELRTLCVNYEFTDVRAAIRHVCDTSDRVHEREARASAPHSAAP